MKKTLLFFLVLLIINCDSSIKKELNLIDFVPTNPVLLVKYNSTIKTNTESFNKNFNLLINHKTCLLYTSPSPRDVEESRMPSSA